MTINISPCHIGLIECVTVSPPESGLVMCMGTNRWGQCSVSQAQANHVYSPIAVQGLQGEVATHVIAGLQHSGCLTASGRVFFWGKGERGQLGHGSRDNSHIPVLVDIDERVKAVSAGLNHTAAVTGEALKHGCVFVVSNSE